MVLQIILADILIISLKILRNKISISVRIIYKTIEYLGAFIS